MLEINNSFKALGDGSRYKIICALLEKNWCVGGLAKKLDMTKPAVSQHLQILRKAGLVTGDKRGYYTHYSVNRQSLSILGMHLLDMANQEPTNECGQQHDKACDC
ncbi:MAG: metalloregulator ArsR/SmtB family transcription factor [Eubacteriales bacterium]